MNGPVVIACPNLSLDRTMLVDRVSTGAVHRSSRTDVRGGGKGVNVARALARMGVRHTLVGGFAAGHTGDAVLGLLRDEGIETLATPCPGETRSCLSVVAEGTVTVFNEEGPPVDQDRWRAYEESLLAMLLPDSVFVCSGSFPPGAPAEGVARLLSAAREAGCATVCDTSREHLAAALDSRPDLIKPNLPEAEALLGGRFREPVDSGG
ncbi:MAG: 1-phosphofructokinase family hexose kinase, partial [Actinomycetota bacterium]